MQRWNLVSICVAQLGVLAALYFGQARDDAWARSQPGSPAIAKDVWLPKPHYDDPDIVSYERLFKILERCRFRRKEGGPNIDSLEHALRLWGPEAEFDDPEIMSGKEMLAILTDARQFPYAFKRSPPPLIIDANGRLDIRVDPHDPHASLHHDHLIACLLEAGVGLDEPVYTPARRLVVRDFVVSALSNFRLDQGEYEWTTLLATYTMPGPQLWRTEGNRRLNVDLLAKRLLRATDNLGVCRGTHRLAAMVALLLCQPEKKLLSPQVCELIHAHLRDVSDRLARSQREDGAWTPAWYTCQKPGKQDGTLIENILVTGHHLEWLSFAPAELLPPRQCILRAAKWLQKACLQATDDHWQSGYSFFTHAASALANWRSVRPAQFYFAYHAKRVKPEQLPSRTGHVSVPTGPGHEQRRRPISARL